MKTSIAWMLVAAAASGCVSKGTYDEAVAQTQITRAELNKKDVELDKSNANLDRDRAQLAQLHAIIGNAIAAEKAADERAALFREIAHRLHSQVDSGDLSLVVRDGRMVLVLPNDVLFDPGHTELKPAGKAALTAIADVIGTIQGRHFQVAGHTDNVPIKNDQFPSNWELSTARALRVTRFLIDKGVHPSALSAAGYADVDPVASDDTPDGRQRNRRTEITLQPNISELVHVP